MQALQYATSILHRGYHYIAPHHYARGMLDSKYYWRMLHVNVNANVKSKGRGGEVLHPELEHWLRVTLMRMAKPHCNFAAPIPTSNPPLLSCEEPAQAST